MNIKYYSDQSDLFHLTANLSKKIIKNHAFQNGNKRVAFIAADIFLKINDYRLQRTPLTSNDNSEGLADAYIKITINQ